jgi:diguanylate cyclase (GGDEF)-like protein
MAATERLADLAAPPPASSRPRIGVGTWIIGALLLIATIATIAAGPSLMSRSTYTALQLGAVGLGVAYALFVALRSRSAHIETERLYSSHLEDLSQRLRTMAYRDVLTGLYNHRYFHEQLAHELERSTRYGQPLSVLLFDMDNFKQINDTYGHITGDKCLSTVGQVVAGQIRSSDIGARYGGDEFAVILPSTNQDEAQVIASKLEDAVRLAGSVTRTGDAPPVAISIGYASCPVDARSARELLELADRRLYAVKIERRSAARLRSTA